MNVAYVRVSSIDQNEERQIEALEKYNIDEWFMEKVSAKDTNRPKLQELLKFVRKGDTVYIHDFSRLARSIRDLLNILDTLTEKGVPLVSIKENIDSGTATGKLMLTVLGAINEFERQNLLERQREGIAIAKQKGLYKGRKAITLSDEVFSKAYAEYQTRKLTKKELAKKLNISRPTLDRILKDKEQLKN